MTKLNLQGYSIAFLAVCYYNYAKLKESSAAATQGGGGGGASGGGGGGDVETTRLLPVRTGSSPGPK